VTPAVDTTRLERVNSLEIKHGGHAPPNGIMEACVMEAVSYVAGEAWSDHPQCACPVVAAFLRAWNDSLPDDASRTRLLRPLVPKIVGSKSTAKVERKRADMAADWLVRVWTPRWLELADLREEAAALRALAPLTSTATFQASVPVLRKAQERADAAWAAARDAAWDAAGAAAKAKIDPVVADQQTSAVDLVERMLAVTE
jgi:hypothetical protein